MEPILEIQGTLGAVAAQWFDRRLPAALARHPDVPVRMRIAFDPSSVAGGADASPPMKWEAAGPLHGVMRRLRLEFLRSLGPAEQRCTVHVGLWLEEDAEASSGVALAALLKTERGAPPAEAPPAAATPEGANGRRPPAEPAAEPLAEPPGRTLPGNLYQDWFGLATMPFNNTPDPHFYFPTDKHQEALSRLIYAISERKGFVLISGEIGSGKSTLCRTLLGQLPAQVKTALITHTQIEAEDLSRAIAEDLGLDVEGLNKYEVLRALNGYLIEQLAADCIVCVIIDEAQHLSGAALEEVRMISNLETESEKLVQLLLLGQPELREIVRQPSMTQLRQRIAVQYHLEPLRRDETPAYVRHRLRVAGPNGRVEWKRRALREVHNYSGGVPRLINTLCDNALLTAYTRQTRLLTPSIVREAARDLALAPQAPGWADFFRMW